MTSATIRRRPPQQTKEVWMEIRDASKLRKKRMELRYTQRDVAFLARRSQAAYQKVESGALKNISEAFAMGLAFALRCDWEDLFIDHEHHATPSVEDGRQTKNHNESGNGPHSRKIPA